jgi:protein-disulfide isomerase-like protein with CxxC motif
MGGQMKQLPLLNGIFKAYAEEQKDIGDIHVLAHIAESAGLMSYQQVSPGFLCVPRLLLGASREFSRGFP